MPSKLQLSRLYGTAQEDALSNHDRNEVHKLEWTPPTSMDTFKAKEQAETKPKANYDELMLLRWPDTHP